MAKAEIDQANGSYEEMYRVAVDQNIPYLDVLINTGYHILQNDEKEEMKMKIAQEEAERKLQEQKEAEMEEQARKQREEAIKQ